MVETIENLLSGNGVIVVDVPKQSDDGGWNFRCWIGPYSIEAGVIERAINKLNEKGFSAQVVVYGERGWGDAWAYVIERNSLITRAGGSI